MRGAIGFTENDKKQRRHTPERISGRQHILSEEGSWRGCGCVCTGRAVPCGFRNYKVIALQFLRQKGMEKWRYMAGFMQMRKSGGMGGITLSGGVIPG